MHRSSTTSASLPPSSPREVAAPPSHLSTNHTSKRGRAEGWPGGLLAGPVLAIAPAGGMVALKLLHGSATGSSGFGLHSHPVWPPRDAPRPSDSSSGRHPPSLVHPMPGPATAPPPQKAGRPHPRRMGSHHDDRRRRDPRDPGKSRGEGRERMVTAEILQSLPRGNHPSPAEWWYFAPECPRALDLHLPL